ncbi:hypothetical protein DFH11DRAFT_1731203 [Phellopilus nigrolimitatus]|nr:hypothetical protein DFH11DRAFT_1731203 [Phellopilus nigrolimitatus]
MSDTLLAEGENGEFDNVPDLIESIFSDAIISRGFPGTDRVTVSAILTKLQESDGPGSHRRMSDDSPGAWVQWKVKTPGRLSREEQIANYMNKMGDKVRRLYSIPSNEDYHAFSAPSRNKKRDNLPASSVREPDICVLNSAISDMPEEEVDWEYPRAVVEHNESPTPVAFQAAHDELLNYARLIFTSQPHRRFVLGMAILGDYATFFYFDRAGGISSDTFHIHENPEKFLRVVVGLLFSTNTDIGYDPTIVCEDEKCFVTVKGKTYEIEETIYIDSSLRGKGRYVTSPFSTARSVPTILAFDVVKIGREKDTTSRLRKAFKKQKFLDKRELKRRSVQVKADDREHRRLVTTPYGDPLESFSSLIELVSATRDLIFIIRDLARKNILHRDLSLRNIILAKLDENSPLRRAFLIDYDSAIDFVQQKELHARKHRTGTLPFMALDVLDSDADGNPRVAHAYYHDLESVFYILCWICTILKGPNNDEREHFNFAASEIGMWAGLDMDNANLEDIQLKKEYTIKHLSRFKSNVLGQFSPYFKDLHPCLLAMRRVLFVRTEVRPHKREKGKAVLDAWAAMSKEDRELASEDFKEKVEWAKEDVPLSDQHQDEVVSDLVKILDDTLDDLYRSKKHGGQPPATVVNNPSALAIDAAAASPAIAARKKKRIVRRKAANSKAVKKPRGVVGREARCRGETKPSFIHQEDQSAAALGAAICTSFRGTELAYVKEYDEVFRLEESDESESFESGRKCKKAKGN